MRIAIDLRSLMESGGKISGVENYTTSLIEHAPHAHKGQATKNQLFGFYNAYKEVDMPIRTSEDFKIMRTRIPNKILNFALSATGYPKFEDLYGDFDVLWLPDLRPFSIKKKTRLAITVHDASPIMHPEFYSLRRTVWHRIINYRKSYARADIIFAVSEYTKYDLIKLFGIEADKIKVVYPGIDHTRFHNITFLKNFC
jgi:glycosyltransferase involved in cell wall biosynthesis